MPLTALAAVLLVSACGATGNASEADAGTGTIHDVAAAAAPAASRPAPAVAAEPVDREMLAEVQRACKADEFGEFVHLFVRAPQIRSHFMADQIEVIRDGRSSLVARDDYDDFPIEALDWNYIVPGSFGDPGDDGPPPVPQYLDIDTRRLADGAAVVDWIRATFTGDDEGDGLGEVIERLGQPGSLTFKRRSDGCWALAKDVRNPADSPFRAGKPAD
ncbi:hypothetical protein ACIPPQ_06290 [Sphingopyxis sp. LARHCG72]